MDMSYIKLYWSSGQINWMNEWMNEQMNEIITYLILFHSMSHVHLHASIFKMKFITFSAVCCSLPQPFIPLFWKYNLTEKFTLLSNVGCVCVCARAREFEFVETRLQTGWL
jgi:hypothetical protein